MHNVFLIAKREYLERIRTKAFILSTVLIPALMGGAMYVGYYTSSRTHTSSHITIVAEDTALALDMQQDLATSKDSKMTIEVISPPTADTRHILMSDVDDKSMDGFLWIDAPATPGDVPKSVYYSRSSANITTVDTLNDAFRRSLTRQHLLRRGVGADVVATVMKPVDIDTQQVDNGQAKSSNSTASFVGVYGLFILMYTTVMMYGMNVSRSIIEEKTSRVFEVLLATVLPEEMLAGKILGVGGVGITQISIWMGTAALLTGSSAAASLMGPKNTVALNPEQIIFFVVYFVLGFLLYSTIAAALGAMVNTEQELQQLNMFIALPLILCFALLATVVTNPNSPLSVAISLFPLCTPLMMYLRISLQMPPWWQIALSIVDMVISIYAVLWVSSRIYRVGVLMYGKRPTLPEILRWLKYS